MKLWRSLIGRLQKLGIMVYGYVSMADRDEEHFDVCGDPQLQGRRPFHSVKAEIDVYMEELGIDGIFTDDVPHNGINKENVLAVTKYVTDTCGLKAIHNPGMMSLDIDLVQAAWRSCYREGVDPGDAAPLEEWPDVPRSKWVMILHHVSPSRWLEFAMQSRDRGYGAFYATDGGWETYPTYMRRMLQSVLA
ncbi:unnamed protein product [Discosporangium mesarthrocarpum]